MWVVALKGAGGDKRGGNITGGGGGQLRRRRSKGEIWEIRETALDLRQNYLSNLSHLRDKVSGRGGEGGSGIEIV